LPAKSQTHPPHFIRGGLQHEIRSFFLDFNFVHSSVFSGIAGAYPHGLGTVNYGPSLESYQVDFTTATKNSINDPYDPGMTLANKSKKSGKSMKSDKSDKK